MNSLLSTSRAQVEVKSTQSRNAGPGILISIPSFTATATLILTCSLWRVQFSPGCLVLLRTVNMFNIRRWSSLGFKTTMGERKLSFKWGRDGKSRLSMSAGQLLLPKVMPQTSFPSRQWPPRVIPAGRGPTDQQAHSGPLSISPAASRQVSSLA